MESELEVLLSTWRRRQKAEDIGIVRNSKVQEFDAKERVKHETASSET